MTLLRTLYALLAAALVAAPVWVLATTGDTVRHQHWALGALLATSVGAGVVLAVVTILRARRCGDGPASGARRRRWWAVVGEVVGALALVGLAAAVVWLRPFSATQPALAALVSDDDVQVVEEPGWIAFVPSAGVDDGDAADAGATTGFVYSPGARVDVRASARVLRPLAEAGYVVVALKEPLGIAFTAPEQSGEAIAAFDGVDRWAVGGHSLGGVVAASYAADHDDVVGALLLHGSYPAGDMSDADAQVTSVWAENDGLTTPDAVESSRADLPPGTTFVEVPGAVHAFFADYGVQPGDGQPTTSRGHAQAQIVDASIDALDRLAAAP